MIGKACLSHERNSELLQANNCNNSQKAGGREHDGICTGRAMHAVPSGCSQPLSLSLSFPLCCSCRHVKPAGLASFNRTASQPQGLVIRIYMCALAPWCPQNMGWVQCPNASKQGSGHTWAGDPFRSSSRHCLGPFLSLSISLSCPWRRSYLRVTIDPHKYENICVHVCTCDQVSSFSRTAFTLRTCRHKNAIIFDETWQLFSSFFPFHISFVLCKTCSSHSRERVNARG